jgi:hypothetical protein
MQRKMLLAVVTATALLVPAGSALAQSPTDAQYDDGRRAVERSTGAGEVPGGGPQASVSAEGGGSSLPFTGTDVIAVAAVALSLLAIGAVLSRFTRSRET